MIQLKMMKKTILFTCMLLSLTGLRTLAQTDNQPLKPVKTGDEWQMPKDVLQRASAFSDSLQKSLHLTDTVKRRVFSAYLGNTKSVDEIRMAPLSENEKTTALAANRKAFDQTLRGILSPVDFDRYIRNEKLGKEPL